MTRVAFTTFSPPHLLALVLIGISAFLLCRMASRVAPSAHRRVEVAVAVAALLWEASWLIAGLMEAKPGLRKFLLPLHLCDFSFISAVIALLWNRRWAIEWTYYLGVGGSLQALLTPDLTAEAWSWTCCRFMSMHGFTATVGVYFVIGRHHLLSWLSAVRSFAAGYFYLSLAAIANVHLQTNYAFLCAKPAGSVLDALGGWPHYLVWMQAIALFCILALHLAAMSLSQFRQKHGDAKPSSSGADALA